MGSWYSTVFWSISMMLLVPMMIFFVCFIDLTFMQYERNNMHLMEFRSTGPTPNQKLMRNGHGISKVHRSINLSIPNGNVKFSEDGTSVTYHCTDNFKLVGSASAVCELDGIWSSPPPKFHCLTNLSIPNGNVKFNENGTSVTYHCADNFKPVGSVSAVCESDGTWSSPPPKCIVHCLTNLSIPNGNVKFNENGTSVTYHCAYNFKPVGSVSSAVCESDGTWSSPPPKCIAWKGCQFSKIPSKIPSKFTEIAERIAADPFELSLAANYCYREFHLYFNHLSKSTINNVCQRLQISKLTSPLLQYKFMYCTGLTLYQFFLNSNGNVQVPKPFHNCKKMSFRDSGIPTMLVSFPGSGNSWVRQLLESTTGIYTGSDKDCDLDYIKIGMLGEGITSDKVIAVKFHWGALPYWTFKKVIYIIRNPYDALVAEYQRSCVAPKFLYTKRTELSINPHLSELGIDKFGDDKSWNDTVYELADKWKEHVQRWLSGKVPYGSTILVVKFEDLLTDLRTELIRMMKYLEYPYTEEDLNCTIKSNTNFFRRHRSHSKHIEHFTQTQIDVVYRKIQEVARFLKNYKVYYKKHVLKN